MSIQFTEVKVPERTILLAGPRGAGKNITSEAIFSAHPNIRRLIAHTTRARRNGEVHGVHYHFVNDSDFERLRRAGALFNSVRVSDTQRSGLSLEAIEAARPVACTDVDRQTALDLKTYLEDRGGKVLLLGILATRTLRKQWVRARHGFSAADAERLLNKEPSSPNAKDYAGFDAVFHNTVPGKPEVLTSVVLSRVHAFLQE